jgi:hypothetical protein
MKSKLYLLLVLLSFFYLVSCKKDQKAAQPLSNTILSFSVAGQFYQSQFNNGSDTVYVIIPHTLKKSGLIVNFTLSARATATVNGAGISNGGVINGEAPLNFKITSGDNLTSASWIIKVQTELEVFGLGSNVTAEKSLDKTYNYYFDQFDGSTYQSINCGPAVSTMAIKWADSTFSKKPIDARYTIPENGGWWFVTDISNYLDLDNIDNAWVPFTYANADSVITSTIDHNNLAILCLDMYFATYNSVNSQHTNKFYFTNSVGWGHFLLVKGYKKVDGKLYYDIYDPYSDGRFYLLGNTLKGQDRYYLNSDIKKATAQWWQNAIIVAPKGQKVATVVNLKVNSIGRHIPIASGQ